MAIYRYTLLRFPLKVNDAMTKIKYVIIFSIWAIVFMFWFVYYGFHYEEKICTYEDAQELKISAVIIFYLTPLVLILTCNVLTIFELRKRNKIKRAKGLGVTKYPITINNFRKIEPTVCNSINGNQEVNLSKENEKNNSKKMFFKLIKPYTCLLLVSLSMIVCFTPYTILAFNESWIKLEIYSISYVCTFLIGIFNPLAIFLYQDSFRVVIKKFLCFKK